MGKSIASFSLSCLFLSFCFVIGFVIAFFEFKSLKDNNDDIILINCELIEYRGWNYNCTKEYCQENDYGEESCEKKDEICYDFYIIIQYKNPISEIFQNVTLEGHYLLPYQTYNLEKGSIDICSYHITNTYINWKRNDLKREEEDVKRILTIVLGCLFSFCFLIFFILLVISFFKK